MRDPWRVALSLATQATCSCTFPSTAFLGSMHPSLMPPLIWPVLLTVVSVLPPASPFLTGVWVVCVLSDLKVCSSRTPGRPYPQCGGSAHQVSFVPELCFSSLL